MKTQLPALVDDRRSRLIVLNVAGALVLALGLVLCLDAADDESRGGSSRSCPAPMGAVDPVTCLPYGPGVTVTPGYSGSSAHQSAPKVKASAAPVAPKAPAVPKAPAAPAVKIPAAPPVRTK